MSSVNPSSTGSSGSYPNVTSSKLIAPRLRPARVAVGDGGSTTAGVVPSTWSMRSSAAAARCPNATVMPIVRSGHTSSWT